MSLKKTFIYQVTGDSVLPNPPNGMYHFVNYPGSPNIFAMDKDGKLHNPFTSSSGGTSGGESNNFKKVVTITSDYQATIDDDIILIDNLSGSATAATVMLPSLADSFVNNESKEITIKLKYQLHLVIGGEAENHKIYSYNNETTVNGESNYEFKESSTFFTDGHEWFEKYRDITRP